jgi:hypothetical protein
MISSNERINDIASELARKPKQRLDAPILNGQLVGEGYATFELIFRGHHSANVAGRRGPYEHYRMVYRYGYDLGVDERFRCVAWAEVELVAQPRWEERNPGTWQEFKESIRYAWDIARGRC